jgi:hypothetical protein
MIENGRLGKLHMQAGCYFQQKVSFLVNNDDWTTSIKNLSKPRRLTSTPERAASKYRWFPIMW